STAEPRGPSSDSPMRVPPSSFAPKETRTRQLGQSPAQPSAGSGAPHCGHDRASDITLLKCRQLGSLYASKVASQDHREKTSLSFWHDGAFTPLLPETRFGITNFLQRPMARDRLSQTVGQSTQLPTRDPRVVFFTCRLPRRRLPRASRNPRILAELEVLGEG